MKIVAISDTHELHRSVRVPDADILIHASDITNLGSIPCIRDFNDWLGELPHRYKIIIAGNHDSPFQARPETTKKLITNGIYLQNESVEIEGIKFWGSPYTPIFMEWSFEMNESKRKTLWDTIPDDTDVVITHGPPRYILDKDPWGESVGCGFLAARLLKLKPKLSIFGHLHESYGIYKYRGTTYVNCSQMGRGFNFINKPVIIRI